jgi:hypothetical protein
MANLQEFYAPAGRGTNTFPASVKVDVSDSALAARRNSAPVSSGSTTLIT